MKAQIAQKARDLGFDACRVTTAEPPTHADVFRDWIAARRHGAMGYLERNAFKRVDPNEVLRGAKSIIVLAASYKAKDEATSGGCSATGKEMLLRIEVPV